MTGPKVEKRKASKVAFIEHKGPYDKVPWDVYIEELYGWAKENRVMPGFHPFAIYYDAPQQKPAEQLRSDICIPYKGIAQSRGRVKVREMSETMVSTVSHKGPGSEFPKTYANLAKWNEEHGYICTGPPIEVYSKKPEVVNGVTILYAKVMFPVRKK
ncbi:MAG: GyrI-like domain-containing protein [Thermoplasmata archaeon]|jgi:effector-binding domain-containing protein|nr:GyrI-like domain-containing protein [Thermoplasmata archaeon]